MPHLPTRIVAWLSLALMLLTGLTPVQGFVVCIEADGCVSIEVKAGDWACGSCEGHESEEAGDVLATDPSTTSGCPCIDYVVPGFPDEHIATSRSLDAQLGAWIVPPAERQFLQPSPTPTSVRGPPPRASIVAPSLAHIRSVILLV